MAVINKRVFDTDNALKSTYNGWCCKWQIITFVCFSLSYAIIVGWIYKLPDYTLLTPKNVSCVYNDNLDNETDVNLTVVHRLTGKSTLNIDNITTSVGQTIAVEFGILCDLEAYIKMPRYIFVIGFVIGALILGFGSDRGGRKIIILACIWTTGIMSLFQIVGTDFISFSFFQFFIGLFIGGIQASFFPAIVEMFPINLRTFFGVSFHLIVCIFELTIPWLAKSFKNWKMLQGFVTVPILLTAILQWFVYESLFWYLAHKEYDKAIKDLKLLGKRNKSDFDKKFKQAREFLHTKYSKSTQVDLLPLLRLQDLDLLGKKYPQVDMAELQKNKDNGSKLRTFLNSLKGASYRSTNTIYNPFDFIYSPTMLIYVFILFGLWFTNGFTDSMAVIKPENSFDDVTENFMSNLSCILSSSLAIALSFIKIPRRWMIFLAYLLINICYLGSLIAKYSYNQQDVTTQLALTLLYHLSRFSTHFGLMFLMLSSVELFPTSLRCTLMGLCFSMKILGSLISSPTMLDYNSVMHRLAYCVLTLFFGSMTLFLPETKSFPLPRSILQIEAMPTAIGKKLRSRKVKLACENTQNDFVLDKKNGKNASDNQVNKNSNEKTNQGNKKDSKSGNTTPSKNNEKGDKTPKESANIQNRNYDTVHSVNDIEQDDYNGYYEKDQNNISDKKINNRNLPVTSYDRTLTNIVEVPSKNITRNNSFSDAEGLANSKV